MALLESFRGAAPQNEGFFRDSLFSRVEKSLNFAKVCSKLTKFVCEIGKCLVNLTLVIMLYILNFFYLQFLVLLFCSFICQFTRLEGSKKIIFAVFESSCHLLLPICRGILLSALLKDTTSEIADLSPH